MIARIARDQFGGPAAFAFRSKSISLEYYVVSYRSVEKALA